MEVPCIVCDSLLNPEMELSLEQFEWSEYELSELELDKPNFAPTLDALKEGGAGGS
jgi:hypothetical protein